MFVEPTFKIFELKNKDKFSCRDFKDPFGLKTLNSVSLVIFISVQLKAFHHVFFLGPNMSMPN